MERSCRQSGSLNVQERLGQNGKRSRYVHFYASKKKETLYFIENFKNGTVFLSFLMRERDRTVAVP
jgi:hypothetical protein